jgi:hypothetical protein
VRRVRGGWAATGVRAKDLELRLRRRSFGEFAAVDARLALSLDGASRWLRLACPSRVCLIHRPETDATGSLDSPSSCAGGDEATSAAEGKIERRLLKPRVEGADGDVDHSQTAWLGTLNRTAGEECRLGGGPRGA